MPDEKGGHRITDLTLLIRTAEGDRAAFDALVGRHGGTVMRVARSLSRSEPEAEDLFQETFLAAFRHAETFRADGSARGWLVSITRRASWKARRRRAGEPEHLEPLEAPDEALMALGAAAGWGTSATPEDLAERSQARSALHAALESLAPAAREVIALRDLAGLTGPEAAETLGIGLGALKTRLHRARLALMAALRRGGHDGT